MAGLIYWTWLIFVCLGVLVDGFLLLFSCSVVSGSCFTLFLNSEDIISLVTPVVSNSLWPHGLQRARLPCPSTTLSAYLNWWPWSRWCHPTISSSVVPFSRLQSFLASGSFPMSQFFTSGGQSIGVSASASVLPMNIRDWFSLGLNDFISL